MEREILLLGDPRLYEISEEVKREELEELRPVIEDMFDCIRGIGGITDSDVQLLRRKSVCRSV